jgi:uncharacterized protein
LNFGSNKKIAIIGTGISGLVTAYLLAPENDIHIYEANDYIGGHTNTVPVTIKDHTYKIDTGFIVFNDRNYPNFTKLLTQNNITSQPTPMSFSVSCETTGLEYNGTSLNGLFAQRINLLRTSFYKMVLNIYRFNKDAKIFLNKNNEFDLSFSEFLERGKYGSDVRDFYIYPMASAIWSEGLDKISDAPFHFFAKFFENHGMLNINDRPQWRVIQGGSQEYVKKLTASFRNRIRLKCPVKKIRRDKNNVKIESSDKEETFDYVILATHSDQALSLLSNPTNEEKDILGNIHYQKNEVLLHLDSSILPKNKRAWACWNYHKTKTGVGHSCVTYNMNMLQGIDSKESFCVSLNHKNKIDPAKIIKSINYDHPIISRKAINAQSRHHEINGINRTFYCGAYWGNGFHEDGVNSALTVTKQFGKAL